MSKPRFFVDQRIGCIAIRDMTHTDPDYRGLHSDTEGVVWYRHGGVAGSTTCPTCGVVRSGRFLVYRDDELRAEELCKQLNESENPDAVIAALEEETPTPRTGE
jgi:hypothetical protein